MIEEPGEKEGMNDVKQTLSTSQGMEQERDGERRREKNVSTARSEHESGDGMKEKTCFLIQVNNYVLKTK